MTNAKFETAIVAMNRLRKEGGVNYSGKLYSTVRDRIELFRKEWGDEFGIDTSIDYRSGFDDGMVIVAMAKVIKDGKILASGHSMVTVGSDDFTTGSPIEVAETSAIGRALACFGLHGGEYSSAQEVQTKSADRQEQERYYSQDHQNRPSNPALNREQPQIRNSEPPKPQPSGLYVPEDDTQPLDAEAERILAVIDGINNPALLGRYWNELKPFMSSLSPEEADVKAEIKAAFATANNVLGGK